MAAEKNAGEMFDAGVQALTTRKLSAAEKAYHELRRRSINYEFRPGARINEVSISKSLGVSRTPLREALNRLESEGFLTFMPNQGFFRRKLELSEIQELIEFRSILESGAVRIVVRRASDESIAELRAFSQAFAAIEGAASIEDIVTRDEEFHERLMALTGNGEMLKRLRVLHGRLRFMRWGDQQRNGGRSIVAEHDRVLAALASRDADRASAVVEEQIGRSREELVEAVKLGYAYIFLRDEDLS